MKRLEQVQGWLSRVQDVQTEVRELARERRGRELARERRGGFCSMNCMSSYKFGEKVVETLQDVQSLRNEGNFKEVAQARPLTENLVDEKALPPIVVGLQDSTNQVWRCLMEEEVGILGLYGMGGVGKTTLLTLINNKISDTPNDFDLVIWVVVSKDLQLKRIQDCIARKIDFATRASNKVVFTTREFEIGGQMEAHKSFEVECLGYDDSWKLFEKEKFLVLAGVGLQNAPGIGLWKEVTRMSLMQIRIRRLLESSSSPHLQTLFLGSNDLNEVNRDFFQFMASLRVLTLSDGSLPGHLLTGISNLVSLQHLDPARSKIRRLPMELKYLVHLKRLNLEFTRLTRIPQEVISNLKMLRVLRMYECGSDKQEGDSILIGGREVLVVEILSLQHLNVLTVTLESFCALRMLLDSPRLQSLSTPSLCLKHCCQSELLTRGFHRLQNICISYSKLKHLTWLIVAPNLKHVRISSCLDLEEIISVEKLGEVSPEVMHNLIPLARIEYLILEDLKNLKSIHSSKLPLDCISGLEHKIIIKGQYHWWKELQWDDQVTQNAFRPCFRLTI
ncbi:putative disease resistance protein [Citrus sinensis]|uniref:Disease resistance protein n=1 Tax=Citrus sinensis TaxID=2711 RepID=A0ACB8JDA0_CITSI|nr:putative disease resistance protein [Citrus sinensis]